MSQNYQATEQIDMSDVESNVEWKMAQSVEETEKIIRAQFIIKVLGILSMQMAITALFVLVSCSFKSFALFQKTHMGLLYLSMFTSIIIIFAISCYRELGRKVPINYILLFIFTGCEGYCVSAFSSFYNPSTVLLAAVMTTIMTFGLVFYALNTKKDFTLLGGVIFTLFLGLILFGFACFFCKSRVLSIVYSTVAVILFGIYLVYDVQLLAGDKTLSLSVDDYIFGAVSIYLDVVNLFIELLKLLGKSQNS